MEPETISMKDDISAKSAKALTRARRYLPLGLIAAGFILALAFDLSTYLSLQSLKDHREMLSSYVFDHFWMSAGLFSAAYTAVVAFSIPGGAVMTLGAGFLFGTLIGGSLVVVSATVGATLIFLAARTAAGGSRFSDILARRAAPWLKKMEQGFAQNATSYLLTLRLVPIFPFFIVNLVPAFLGVRLPVYVLTTFFGIIPGTFIYASVGSGMGHLIDQGQDPDLNIIFSPEILLPLLGLAVPALLPVLYKKLKQYRGG